MKPTSTSPSFQSTTPRRANIDTATVAQGGTTTIALTANDTDVDDAINATTVAITQQPTAGSVTVNPNGTVTYTSDGSAVTTDSFHLPGQRQHRRQQQRSHRHRHHHPG